MTKCKYAVLWVDPIDGAEEKFKTPRCMKKQKWITPQLCINCDSYLVPLKENDDGQESLP